MAVPRTLSAAALMAVFAVAPASARADGTVLATGLDRPAALGASGGTVVWWQYDGAGRRFVLMRSDGAGTPQALPGPITSRRATPVDVGLQDRGALIATTSIAGALRRISLTSGRALKQVTRHTITGPVAGFRHRLAFTTGSGRRQQLYYLNESGGERRLGSGDIRSIDIGGMFLAYVDVADGAWRVHLRSRRGPRGRDRLIYRAARGHTLTQPSFSDDGTKLFWTEADAAGSSTVMRYATKVGTFHRVLPGTLTYASGPETYRAAAWSGDTLGLAYATTDTVGVTGPFTFHARR